jgi:hypothetical protein
LGMLLGVAQMVHSLKQWLATFHGAMGVLGVLLLLLVELMGRHIFALLCELARMAMLWLPCSVLLLLLSPLPGPLLPFPYLLLWRTSASVPQLPLYSLIWCVPLPPSLSLSSLLVGAVTKADRICAA